MLCIIRDFQCAYSQRTTLADSRPSMPGTGLMLGKPQSSE